MPTGDPFGANDRTLALVAIEPVNAVQEAQVTNAGSIPLQSDKPRNDAGDGQRRRGCASSRPRVPRTDSPAPRGLRLIAPMGLLVATPGEPLTC